MKIVYFARRPVPSVNAHSVQIVSMCEAFGKLGHDVTLLAHRGDEAPGRTYDRYGVEKLFRIETFPFFFRKYRARKRFVRKVRGDRSLSRADLFFGRDIWSLAAMAGRGIPIVYEAHTIPPEGNRRRLELAKLFAHPDFHHVVCVTGTIAEQLKDVFPVLADKLIQVVPNAAAAVAPNAPAEPWPGRPGKLQVGFVGRPYPGKGIELLAEAAERLPDLDFHIVGGGASDLHWLAGPLPVNFHLHGYQPHGALGRFYARFDIAAAPYGEMVMNYSGFESGRITSPLKLAEYMAAGLPSVVSDLPGVRDMLGESRAALLITPGNSDELVVALERLTNEDFRREMSRAAVSEYEARHTIVARARKVLEPLEQAVQQR